MLLLFNIAYAREELPLLRNIKEQILAPLVVLLFALAFLTFLYGVYEMIRGAGSDEARRTGEQHVLWGVIGLFIMVAVFGIMNVICQTIKC